MSWEDYIMGTGDYGEDEEDEDLTVWLTDEDGVDIAFELLDMIHYGEEDYAVLLPAEEQDGTVVILRVESDDDNEADTYTSVDDEAVLDAVYSLFKERFKDSFEFED